jgi:predicted DNA-binding WGR domain protein
MPRYELSEGTSNKFWHIELNGSSFTTTYGRIGSTGQSTVKTFDSAAKAQAEYAKLIAEKVKKGYTLVDGAAPPPPAPVRAAPTPAPVPVPAAVPAAAAVAVPVAVPAAAAVPGSPTLTWTSRLGATARKQRDALAIAPLQKGVASSEFQAVHELFMQAPKAALEHGKSRGSKYQGRSQAVLRTYSFAKMPEKLDVQLEADALLLVPTSASSARHATLLSKRAAAAVHAYWVAHSGLPFALEAFAASLGPVAAFSDWQPHAVWLGDSSDRAVEDLLGWYSGRHDRILRAYLLSASPEEQAAARAKAEELRSRGDLLIRSAMSAVFLDPAWLDADLEERTRTGARAIITEQSLLHASPAVVAALFAAMDAREIQVLAPEGRYAQVQTEFSAAYLDLHREAGIVPLARWLARATELYQTASSYRLLYLFSDLLDTLSEVSGSPELVSAATSLLDKLGDDKLNKAEDPRPAAVGVLRHSAAIAAPLVREAAKAAWARDLAPQLERLAGTASEAPLVEAGPGEVPPELAIDRPFKAPSFWAPEAFARPKTASGKALPRLALDALGALLAKGDTDALAAVRESCDRASLAAFAWDLFQAWLTTGANAKDKWAFLALGYLGNDEIARRLTPLIRAWPGESAHQRAVLGLDVLGEIGTDVALMMLNGIAQKVKFKGLQERARDKMDAIAQKRGLTAEELADRLVPDLDLEDDGSKTLDFGPRSFRVGFDETLSPFVMDASGSRLKDLPKPGAKDDPELSTAAAEAWKAMKKDARALASLEILRLELAMANERRWLAGEFDAFLVHHPLMIHLVRRLVWGAFDAKGKLLATFRVAEDRTCADRSDEAYQIPTDVEVGAVHRLRLSDDDVKAWSRIFADYELAQPFEQLAREVYVVPPGERQGVALARFEGRIVETKKVLGLQSRGWRRGSAHDNGCVPYFYKPIAKDLNAGIQLENGISIGAMDYTDPTQTLGIVDFGSGEPDWGRARPNAVPLDKIADVVMSEVVRDLEALGKQDEQEA